ncbi:MAG: hypothetical protein R3C97_07820 [Geminicoccaceae bacterium]
MAFNLFASGGAVTPLIRATTELEKNNMPSAVKPAGLTHICRRRFCHFGMLRTIPERVVWPQFPEQRLMTVQSR